MLEIKLIVEAPELSNAMTRLADALQRPTIKVEDLKTETLGVIYDDPNGIKAVDSETVSAAVEPEPMAETVEPVTETVEPAPAVEPEPEPAPAPAPAPERKITFTDISNAGAKLMDDEKLDLAQLAEMLKKYGVEAITQLSESDYPKLAADLRALGADI